MEQGKLDSRNSIALQTQQHRVGLKGQAEENLAGEREDPVVPGVSAHPEEGKVAASKDREPDIDLDAEEDEEAALKALLGIEDAEEEVKTTKKIWNATSRRRGAFRRGLVRCVMLMHEAFLRKLGAADFDPLREGSWHEGFPIADLPISAVLKATEDAGKQLDQFEQSGRIK